MKIPNFTVETVDVTERQHVLAALQVFLAFARRGQKEGATKAEIACRELLLELREYGDRIEYIDNGLLQGAVNLMVILNQGFPDDDSKQAMYDIIDEVLYVE